MAQLPDIGTRWLLAGTPLGGDVEVEVVEHYPYRLSDTLTGTRVDEFAVRVQILSCQLRPRAVGTRSGFPLPTWLALNPVQVL